MTTNQPAPVEPAELTDQELLRTYNEELLQTYNARNYINEERVRAATIAGLRAVIAADRARRATPPAPAEPADMAVEQLQHIIHREPWATWLRPGGCLESAHCELNDLLSSVIATDRARRAAPPAEGEVVELVAKLRRLALQNPLGTADPTIARAAALIERQTAELAECREALRRVRLEQRIPGGFW